MWRKYSIVYIITWTKSEHVYVKIEYKRPRYKILFSVVASYDHGHILPDQSLNPRGQQKRKVEIEMNKQCHIVNIEDIMQINKKSGQKDELGKRGGGWGYHQKTENIMNTQNPETEG